MEGHVAGHADSIPQVAQRSGTAGRRRQCPAPDQGSEGRSQGQIEARRPRWVPGQDRSAVLQHPAQGHSRGVGWFGLAGFRIGRLDRPGAPINPGGQLPLNLRATGVAAAHLGR